MTTDLIPSISIANLVQQRAAIMEMIGKAREILAQAEEVADAA